jgi:hypothetical protein
MMCRPLEFVERFGSYTLKVFVDSRCTRQRYIST